MSMERPPTGHDVELAALAAAGDRRAYGELVRRHGSAIRGLLRRMGADSATADDIAQDAFLAGFEQVADYRGEGAFGGWIKRIAARLYLRKVKRDTRVIFTDEAQDGEDPIGARRAPDGQPHRSGRGAQGPVEGRASLRFALLRGRLVARRGRRGLEHPDRHGEIPCQTWFG
jgi:DNA-directed RNA polymerase specialized sigma24 family protein